MHLIAEEFPLVAKIFPFMFRKPFGATARSECKDPRMRSDWLMKNVVPLFLALIPLVAVVGACVAVP